MPSRRNALLEHLLQLLHGGLVVSSVADSSTEFDVRQANSYAIAEGEKGEG